jgi:hypothetical protein
LIHHGDGLFFSVKTLFFLQQTARRVKAALAGSGDLSNPRIETRQGLW